METSTNQDVAAFVGRLARARDRIGPGGVAALRRGTGRSVGDPAAAAQAFFSLHPPNGVKLEPASWTAATLWARHERHSNDAGSYGASLGQLARRNDAAAGRLLARLLASDREEMPSALRRSITLLREHSISIDYVKLTWDLAKWSGDERDVQRTWARDFYRTSRPSSDHPHPTED